MHIAINAWFWDQPHTGSGQYLRSLVTYMAGQAQITLVAPRSWQMESMPPGVVVQPVQLRRTGRWGKTGFEQQIFPDVAHAVGADLAHVPYWAAPLRSPVPVVVTVHDIIPLLLPDYRGGILGRLYTGLVAASARGASAVITDSDSSAADIVEHLQVDPKRLYPIPLAAGPQYQPEARSLVDMSIRQKYDLPEEYVLYLGGYDIRKNVRTLLKAYTYVAQGVGLTVPLVLAGKLPERITPRFDDIHHWIETMALEQFVRLIGFVEEAEKPTLYRDATVFAYPSRYEGFGLPVLEAMACGTPVVATTESSIPEIVGDAGFLVDPDDARSMGGSILANITQEDTRQRSSERGLAQAARFSWERTAADTLGVYHTVLSG
ncbi:MAG: glycosyltransferase family 4 protein [Chloroflexi bacterium]|nr:glycosyltransferase family 4 protein [Chloroflexota bacterium]